MGKIIELNSRRKDKMLNNEKEIQKNKLYVLIGIPCSGKTTYARKYFKELDVEIISTDEIRKNLTGTYRFSTETNNLVFSIAKDRIKEELSSGLNVVFDATNTNKKYRKDIIKIGQKMNSDIIALVFNTPLNTCLARNSLRGNERRVPEEIIIKMSSYDSDITEHEGFSNVQFID